MNSNSSDSEIGSNRLILGQQKDANLATLKKTNQGLRATI